MVGAWFLKKKSCQINGDVGQKVCAVDLGGHIICVLMDQCGEPSNGLVNVDMVKWKIHHAING